jgi:hypothetical protein
MKLQGKVLRMVTYLYFGPRHVACHKILSFPLLQDVDSLSGHRNERLPVVYHCLTLAVLERNFHTQAIYKGFWITIKLTAAFSR